MKKALITALFACVLMLAPPLAITSHAVTTSCDTYQGSNVEDQDYKLWSYTVDSYLAPSKDGGLMRVQGSAVSGKILIEYYDSSYNFLSSKTISSELPIFGAFYETDSNYYILSGQTNYNENDSVEVYRITKYDKNWKRISSCGLYGANTYIPFDAGSARMTDNGKYLLIRTCHEMYKSSDGYHHQANVTIQVNMDTMTITDSYSDVMNSSYGYVSHSFNQFIKTENGHIIAVDHGDAYPRSIALIKYTTDYTTGKFTPTWGSFCTVVDMLKFPGDTGNNYTGASVGGFEISDTAYIVAGNYTGDANYSSISATRNIFVATLSKSSSTPTYKQITSYTSGTASTPHLVKIGTNSYMLMWSYNSKVYYTKLDGNGNTVGSTYSMAGSLSDCVPVVYNGKLVWYTWSNETVTFYSINISSLSSNSKTVLENGHKYVGKVTTAATCTSTGVKTYTCSACGDKYTETIAKAAHTLTVKDAAGGNKATQSCTKCSYSTTFTVPTDYDMWWRENADNGYYWSSYSTTYHTGDTLDVWADITNSVDNSDMVFEISDSSVATLSSSGYSDMRRITMKNTGSFTLKVYPRYNKTKSKTYSFTVAHQYTNKVVAPTYEAQGYTLHTCSVCGYSYKDSYTAKKTVAKVAVKSTYTNATDAIRINWDKVSDASGYKIFRYNSKTGVYDLISTINGNTVFNYRDSGLASGTTYKYQVQAYVSVNGSTHYYSPMSDTITAMTVPAAPKSKTEYTNATDAIRVNWEQVTGASGYKIFRYNPKSGKYELVGKVTDYKTLNFRDSGLASGTTYKYQVQAYKSAGNGKYYYSAMSSTITAMTKPAAPKVKSDYTYATDAVRINWEQVTGASGYKIFRYNPKSGKYELVGKVTNYKTLNFRDSGLTPGTTYKYQVQAYKSAGNGKYYYSTMSSTITAATKPAATKITKNTKAATAVRLYWNKVSCTGYKIQQYKNGQWVTIKKVAMGTTEYRVEGLSRNTSYKFRIQPYYTVNGKILYGAVSAVYTAVTAK